MEKAVLIVDDSPTMRKLLCFAMKKVFGFFKTLEAGDGLEAINALSTSKVDLVICDINMPNMDGFEFLESIRKEDLFRDLPVIVLSTEGQDSDRERALKLGATTYIQKPFKPAKLKDVIDDILKQPAV